ncbi:hypothetical protein [Paenibacillus sanfengchensis]|uniref:hypothetical protein n=1 Tax=Paenibacillus sanfengchensis TaxID=3119819 RepID=UPI002FE282B2
MNIYEVGARDYLNALNYSNNPIENSRFEPDFRELLGTTLKNANNKSTFVSAEHSLKEIYPDLKYHVLDASRFKYWERLDFPTSKLFKDTVDENTINELSSWKPKTRLASGYEPWVQQDLEKIPSGAHVVIIHPEVQEKMNSDSEYAKQIAAKVKKYFDDDIRLNAAIDPESVESMSQLVTIKENGEIGYHHTVCDGPSEQKDDFEEAGLKHSMETSRDFGALRGMKLPFSPPLVELLTTPSLAFGTDYSSIYALYSLNHKRKTDIGFYL